MILAFGHALRAHEALGRPDALPGFLEVVQRLFEDGVFVRHDKSIRIGGMYFGDQNLPPEGGRTPSRLKASLVAFMVCPSTPIMWKMRCITAIVSASTT